MKTLTNDIYLRQGTELINVHKCANKVVEPHDHEFLEIVYILTSNGEHDIGGKRKPVSAGDIYVITPGVTHSLISYDKEHPIEHYNCLLLLRDSSDFNIDYTFFHGMAFDMLYNHILYDDTSRLPYIELRDTTTHIKRLLKLMCDECEGQRADVRNMLIGCAIELLVWISRIYKEQHESNPLIANHRKSIESVLLYLEENYKNQITLNELSRIALFTPSYLCTLFKNATNCSITEYIQSLRNKRAAQLLTTTDWTIEKISYEIGYKSERFFRIAFKREFGLSPSEYRMKNASKK